jgi:hypothetical protein
MDMNDLIPTLIRGGLTSLSLVVAATTVSYLVFAVLAIRSKVRARELLRSQADYHLRLLQERLLTQPPSPEELAAGLKTIEKIIENLPARDRKVIAEGLHQQNRVGAERFLKELIGDAGSERLRA